MVNSATYKGIVVATLTLILHINTTHSQQILSLNPLFTEQTAQVFTGIECEWKNRSYNLSVTIKRSGDNFYLLTYDKATSDITYEAVFVTVANTIFLDLSPKIPDTLGDNDYRSQLISAHSLYKVKIVNDTLQLAELNYRFFYNQLAKNKSLLSYSSIGGGILLTISTEELKRFIEEHKQEPGFFDDSILLIRDPILRQEDKKGTASISTKSVPGNFSQSCIPEFPHKDGWLGGDADVSVPVNDTQSIYIFGDTYVGKKNDSRQSKGLKMVSSTVAVAYCSLGGKKDIKYYWRNMYSNHPEPVFRSFTNRYNLWVSNAFMHKDCLYVLMQKTGAKAGVNPDDFFPFNIIGLTFAKVINPAATTPDKWDINLIPVSLDAFPMDKLHITLVKNGSYLYLFAEYDSKVRLLRIDLEYIDNAKNHFEYYSVAHTWKRGLKTDDMEIVLSAQIGSTINYHDELKKWVMVCGPGFMNNKIGIRTATSLTGPWSNETVVYVCPEVTPGTTSYNRSNFCYFGRECFQNYDKKNRSMVITYDINSSDFSEINLNPKIYTPKVITVPIMKYGIR